MWSFLASRWVAIALAVTAVALVLERGLAAMGGPERLRDHFGPLAPLVSAAIHAPLAASPFPSEVFAISHGPLYGLWLGSLVGWAGWFAGSLLEFVVLQRWRVERVPSLAITRPRWLARFPTAHPVFLIGVRQLPAGYHLVNVGAAMTGVPFWRFTWCSAIAQVPNAVAMSAVGLGIFAL